MEFFDVDNFSSKVFERVIKTNYLGAVYGTEAALPLLERSSSAHLVLMCSITAYSGIPRGHEAYSAAKAAIRKLSQALRIDFLPKKIYVSLVCPGFVKTKISNQNDFYMPAKISAKMLQQL